MWVSRGRVLHTREKAFERRSFLIKRFGSATCAMFDTTDGTTYWLFGTDYNMDLRTKHTQDTQDQNTPPHKPCATTKKNCTPP